MTQVAYDKTLDFHIEKHTSILSMHNMHYHHTHELYYCLRGEREYFIGDEFYRVTEGDIVLIPREIIHRTGGKVTTRILIYFSDVFLSRFFTDETLATLPLYRPLIFRPEENLRTYIEAELNKMMGEYSENGDNYSPVLASRLIHMLFSIFTSANNYIATPYSDRRIGQIVRYINDNYSEINDIKQIADHFFISKYHLCRTFNRCLGIPLISYLNTVKIRAATDLMKNEKLKLTDIATGCGFNSSSYLCKVFKAEKGVSPTEYRKNLRSKK
ncbi:MAG: helix-turn-helix domain-containing protein [Clostridia bacterium]|nr:helix-turn-helix domain-containing protein [Clostridia bacterium]